ncbi:MAG: FAD-dependent oxidoreductase [Lachnospiraceae bacterium]|nr:FAD-dependent oxidoreductase [Lachnospiraceae bacterium]
MKYDGIMIGFGKAGKTLAGVLAKKGGKVALIEKSDRMYGGTCINVGCIPSKSLITSAEHAGCCSDGDFSKKADYYKSAVEEKRRVTSMLRKKNYDKLNDLEGVTIYDGIGHFLSATQVQVDQKDGSSVILEAEKIFINTGSEPVKPGIPGIENNPKVYNSESLMDEEKLPGHLILIGAGYIGMEFASMYRNFGSEVTVLQDGGNFLPREDRDVAEEIRHIMENRGIKFLLGAKTTSIDGGRVLYEKDGSSHEITGDAILIATGRRANTRELDAERAGITLTSRGAVQVDEYLKTDVPNIWAMGDVNGGPQFTFVSLDDYRIVLAQLEGKDRSRAGRVNVPYSVFMDTPLGRVGMTEAQAREKGIPVKVAKLPTAAVPKAQVLRKTDGFLKAMIHAETGKILGAALLCPEAYEMINLIKLAMDMDADYTVLRDQIYTHPTMTEAFNDLFAV